MTVPHSKPWIVEDDVLELAGLLRGGMLAQGEKTAEFERKLAEWLGISHPGVAVGSGSAAIVLALTALEVGSGDEVIVTSYNCTKVLEAVLSVGAGPVLSDIGPNWRLRPDDVRNCLTRKTKAIIVPHFMGLFSDVPSFRELGVPIIEDCAQAIGNRGEHRIDGDISIFSFHPTKLITTGEGGMAVAREGALAERMRYLRDGDERLAGGRLFSPLSDLSSALGLSQLRRYPEALARRRDMASRYHEMLRAGAPGIAGDFPCPAMHFRFPVEVEGGTDRYAAEFLRRGVKVSKGVDALLHRTRGMTDERFPESVRLYSRTISLPIYPALIDVEFMHCANVAVELLGRARG